MADDGAQDESTANGDSGRMGSVEALSNARKRSRIARVESHYWLAGRWTDGKA